METKEVKKIDCFCPTDEDEFLPAQIAEVLEYSLAYGYIKFMIADTDEIKENDIIFFNVKERLGYNKITRRESRINEHIVYEKIKFSNSDGQPYYFVTRFLYETRSHLYFWHKKKVKRIPLSYLDPFIEGDTKLYKKVISIDFCPEVENA